VLCFRQPGLDRTGNALQPQHGEAQTTLDEMTSELGLPPQPLWVIISGKDELEVYQRLTNADRVVERRGFKPSHRPVSAADRAVAAR
jgi:hypothetical protein